MVKGWNADCVTTFLYLKITNDNTDMLKERIEISETELSENIGVPGK